MSGFDVSFQNVEDSAVNASPLFCNGHGTPVPEQHDIQHDSSAQFYIIAQLLCEFLRGYDLSGHRTEKHQDGTSIHAGSSFRIPTQDLFQFLKCGAFTKRPSVADGNETPEEQNGPPYSTSWWIPGVDLYHFLQSCADPAIELPSSDGHKIPAEQDDMPAVAPLLLISGEHLSAFLEIYEISAGISYPCPLCGHQFRRRQERDRHFESYLPHSIYCPFEDCTWTGRRQWDFKEHWKRKHKGAGQAPGEDKNVIYDPKDFVKSIVSGRPVKEVAQSAFAEAQEYLEKQGKLVVGANVLGRKRDLL